MIKRFSSWLSKFPAPGIYFVFPGKKQQTEDSSVDRSVLIPQEPALVLDTSAIIDGRIADIVTTGFVSGTFVVPSFIIQELQQVADSKDTLKRNRGRRGLDVLRELRRSRYVKFKVVKVQNREDSVDAALLAFAKRLKGRVITTDYNLNKVGKVTGVPILNVNELANMVKTVLLPNETFQIQVMREGKEKNQGVGYLPDGTMVVIQDGAEHIGREIELVVDRVIQTNAGKMVFAKLA